MLATDLASRKSSFLGCGGVSSITAAQGKIAIATLDRKVRIFDVSGERQTLERTLSNLPSSKVEYIDGGRYLVMGDHSLTNPLRDDRAIRRPDHRSLLHTWEAEPTMFGQPDGREQC